MSNTKYKIFNKSKTILDTKKSFNDLEHSTQLASAADENSAAEYVSKKPTKFTDLMRKNQNIQEIDLENSGRSTGCFVDVSSDKSTISTRINSFDTNDGISKGLPYTNSYIPSFQIDQNDQRRDSTFFLQDIPINIQIIGHEEEASLVLLHTNVYTISITHSDYSWTIKRRYKHFLKLYEAYALFKTKLNIRNAAVAHLTPNAAVTQASVETGDKKFNTSDHFKLLFQSIASDFAQAKHILQKFLQDVLDHKMFRNHNETLKFLEVSHLSFISDLGDKNKEGLIKKRTMNIHLCASSLNLSFFWDNRWLIVKDTFVAYLDNKTGEIRCVLLVDQNFNVSSGHQATGKKYGLFIENLSRNIFAKCYNEKRAMEWSLSIMKMIQSTGSCFRYPQRFDSFAPIREKSQVKWFVDGSDYMESIANSIESAKQEIFITGFFLSPEIYLKRPVVIGDKWRLDKLLQRKAEEGVKIYVLIYKEIEITLPINSAYSKRILTLSHKNIKVLRHPDHINEPNQFFTIMWAHHEKLVIVDQSVAYFGGIDLCYGRWDNNQHKLTDLGSVLSSNTTPITSTSTLPSGSFSSLRNHRSQKKSMKAQVTSTSCSQNSVAYSNDPFTKNTASNIRNYSSITKHNSDENNNELENNKADALAHLSAGRVKALRMISSPAHSFETQDTMIDHEKFSQDQVLSRNFLIDNMTDYYNNFIKKDINIEDLRKSSHHGVLDSDINHIFMAHDYYENSSGDKKESRFDKLFRLKRSKSLEISSKAGSSMNDATKMKETEVFNNPFKMLRDSLNYKLKSNHQSLKLFQREYKELSIFNKLKKIKQFKESLKRYALNKYQDSESSFDQYDPSSVHCRQNDDDDQEDPTTDSLYQKEAGLLAGSSKLWIGKDYCNFIFKDVVNVHSPFQDSIDRKVTPRMPWHDVAGCVVGAAARDIARHFIQRWNYIKLKKVRNDKSYVQLIPKAYKNYTIPREILHQSSCCNVQTLRSVSTWSAGVSKTESSIHVAMCHLIRTAKHYVYIENQFFISLVEESSTVRNEIAQCLYERIVRAHNEHENFKVYIFLPLIPGYAGEYGRSSGVLLHTITHYNNTSINGLIKKLADSSIDALNYIFFFGLRTWSELNNSLITELIYVHSKLLIVDDRACIIGSANINDRSLLGNRDSEVALYIEDTQFVDGRLNRKPCQVGKFTSTLRHRLFTEFLGELTHDAPLACTTSEPASESLSSSSSLDKRFNENLKMSFINQNSHQCHQHASGSHHQKTPKLDLTDPCSDEFYKQVLLKYAAQNTKIYDSVFKCLPCDLVSNFEQLKEYNKLSGLSQTDAVKAKSELNKIKGFIVLYPYRFLNQQDLTPPLGTKEKLLPTRLWT